MRVCSKHGQFFRLPSFPKGDRDDTRTGPSYYSDAASDDEKEIHALTEWLVALNRFISRYSDRLWPFFKALKGADAKGWGPECMEFFRAIKEYIAFPLSLSQLVGREELYLYLSTSATMVSVSLVRLDYDKRQRPVYFVNKALTKV